VRLIALVFLAVGGLAAGGVQAAEKALTLEAALAAADAPHPQLQSAQAQLDLALADQQIASSSKDATLTLEGALRRGQTTLNPPSWLDDNSARLVLRKPLLDFGREQGFVEAARQEVNAQRLALLEARDARRIDIMARYFDVLLADAQAAADNEYTAAYYVSWDDAKKRFELGELNSRDLTQLEARYQDQREKRNRSQTLQRTSRQKLSNAINQPGHLPNLLDMPRLPQNNLALPEYEDLLPLAMQHNRKLLALQSRLNGVASRTDAIRASRAPTVDMELSASDYSRDTVTRDRYSGGLVLNWPIYQGERVDGKLARESAERIRIEAQAEQFRRDLAESLLDTWLEIDWLKNTARPAAKVQINYRDQALERARAEYEMEMKTNLGTAMADTQAASLRSQQVEFRLALAIARLEALLGQPIAEIIQPKLAEKK
jgi:outer membrane protein TolC